MHAKYPAYSRQARKKLASTLSKVLQRFLRLAERRKQMTASLSGGEQQMPAIGRGLMSLPRLLMLDKPSPGLAHILVKLVFEIIEGINRQGVIILFVEQNVNSTLETTDKEYILETGGITLQGRDRGIS